MSTRWLLLVAVFTLFVIQLVPYGRRHSNPPTRAEPSWDTPRTRELVVRACFDCHSNETIWPWYSHLAPASWLVQRDVARGRRKLNYSEWDRPQREAHESAEVLRKGSMPPWLYVGAHPRAQLAGEERRALTRGLVATFGRERERD